MKSFLLLLSLVTVLVSCTTAYKSGQTPDDVYFSPARVQDEYVRVENEDDRKYKGDDYYAYEDDRYLRIKVRDRNRWSYLDDYYYEPYAYSYSKYNFYNNCYCNPYQYWNSYYSPYGSNTVIVNTKSPVYNKPRTYNLHVFDDPKSNAYDPKSKGTRSRDYSSPSETRNSTRSTGNDLRNVFRGSDNYSSPKSSPSYSESPASRSSGNTGDGNKSSGTNAPARKN